MIVMVMTLLCFFLPVAARLACVGDGDVVDEDEREVGTVGKEDDEVTRAVDNDDGTALVGSMTEDGGVDLFDAICGCEDVVFVTAVAEFCALHSAWKN